ncbi:hypothetical protein CEXT_806521 [Caerostris extrusa]|uniref:Uncharacterized protein n=1 Tax=Caerostris extrusa TaxID=172846 RepID=A0AAV4UCB1_CAEEX|nr:hypothetical protein CEXT_806521 [Caerostris extrusa]
MYMRQQHVLVYPERANKSYLHPESKPRIARCPFQQLTKSYKTARRTFITTLCYEESHLVTPLLRNCYSTCRQHPFRCATIHSKTTRTTPTCCKDRRKSKVNMGAGTITMLLAKDSQKTASSTPSNDVSSAKNFRKSHPPSLLRHPSEHKELCRLRRNDRPGMSVGLL